MTRIFRLALAAALALPAAASAQEECNFETNSGRIANSYELVGVDACIQSCAETDTCTAWLYTPNTFNPDTAPGQCQLYAEASGKREPNATASTQFCGQMEN